MLSVQTKVQIANMKTLASIQRRKNNSVQRRKNNINTIKLI